jgi:hypothetical protein
MREATRECPAPKDKGRFSGRVRKKSRPPLAIAARALRGRFVVEGTGKAEPRSSRRAQAKHRAGDREKAGKNWRDGSHQNLLRERGGMEAYCPETALPATQPSSHSTAAKHAGEYMPTQTALLPPPALQAVSEMATEEKARTSFRMPHDRPEVFSPSWNPPVIRTHMMEPPTKGGERELPRCARQSNA